MPYHNPSVVTDTDKLLVTSERELIAVAIQKGEAPSYTKTSIYITALQAALALWAMNLTSQPPEPHCKTPKHQHWGNVVRFLLNELNTKLNQNLRLEDVII